MVDNHTRMHPLVDFGNYGSICKVRFKYNKNSTKGQTNNVMITAYNKKKSNMNAKTRQQIA